MNIFKIFKISEKLKEHNYYYYYLTFSFLYFAFTFTFPFDFVFYSTKVRWPGNLKNTLLTFYEKINDFLNKQKGNDDKS